MEAIEIGHAATDADREAIYRLRYDVYIEEMNKPYATADRERRRLTDALDESAALMFARAGGEMVGTLRVHQGSSGPLPAELRQAYGLERFYAAGVREQEISVLSRLILRADYRSGQLTFELLRRFAETQAAAGIQLIFLQCHPHLVNFYGTLGFRPSGNVVNDPAAGVLVPMVLLTADRAHLVRLGSPLAAAFAGTSERPELRSRVLEALPASPGIVIEGAETDAFWAEVSTDLERQEMLGKSILDGLPDDMIKALFARSLILEMKDGDYLIRKGQVLRTVFIVLSGSLEVLEGERTLQVAREGAVVGEVAFLLGTPRTRDVRALGDGVRVLALSERSLRALIDETSRGAALLLLNLSKALAAKLAQGPEPQ